MKKQNFYILLFLLLPPSIVFSQTEKPLEPTEIASNRSHNEIGFNLGYLINNLIRNETPTANLTDRNYLLSFKRFKQNNNYVRYGLSFNYSKSKEEDNNQFLRGDIRIGYESQFLIFKDKFQLNPGFDMSLTYFQNKVESNGFLSIIEKQKYSQIGPIPFLGLQYNINPRIHLSTEMGLAFFFTKRENFFNPSFGFADGEGVNVLFQMPQEFILSVSF